MYYLVTARPIESAMADLHRRLTDGSIESQKPDGEEIVDSMERAKIDENGTVTWTEQCFCVTPLAHERETVYDHYFTDLDAEPIDDYRDLIAGTSFMEYLERHATPAQKG